MTGSIIQTFLKIQNSAQYERTRKENYDLLHVETKVKFLCLPYTKRRKRLLRKRKSRVLNKKQKEGFWLLSLSAAIKKDLTTSIRKHANELKFQEKTVRIAIKLELSPDRNPLDYAILGILEKKNKKTNATSHPDIGSLKTAIEEVWDKMSEEFILKACKYFRMHVDIII